MPAGLSEIVRAQKRGEARGITSICSAHPWILQTALKGDSTVLIEATCNQVNQFGGYTGMTPGDFRAFVQGLARANGFPLDRLILGGDHLGPSPWQNLPAAAAMENALELVTGYVQAGFTKIHLDTSMRLGDDDPVSLLDLELAAQRTARLAKAAEASAGEVSSGLHYVIGTEVPLPGGAHYGEPGLHVTTVTQARDTLEAIQAAFISEGLQSAWERTIALVVQPGVEFGSDYIIDYEPASAVDLARFVESTPFIYEAHSTDYQSPKNLHRLVRDHFAILKVGPALTFAYREAIFGLARVEAELFPLERRSHLIEEIEAAMLREPHHWQDHYQGTDLELALARKYSLSDRIRYYWAKPSVQRAVAQLLQNFSDQPLPLSLVSQYFHSLSAPIREDALSNSAASILTESVLEILRVYDRACQPENDVSTASY